ncbi:hypothetical protein OEA41_003367 [Lepraria neglecta]|uniref:Origin recognition complex subunit 4 n=1 Tax=Lepraria neglecta TaxID=209136 RepID=A0AAE0DLE0_9LECA|nr:hypothetical protein OEA41_003367 [Lepraria neglecta]
MDPSPRAAKRRKTTTSSTPDESPLPFHSRVLKTVKQAVYGKAASPKINLEFGKGEGEVTPIKSAKNNTPRKKHAEGDNVEGERERERESPVVTRVQRVVDTDQTEGADGEGEEQSAVKRTKSGKRGIGGKKEGDVVKEGGKERGDLQTPTKNKRKKFKGYVWLDEVDELGLNGAEVGAGVDGDGVVEGEAKRAQRRSEEVVEDREGMNGLSTEDGLGPGSSKRSSGRLGRERRRSGATNGDVGNTPASRQKRQKRTEGDGATNGNGIATPGRPRKEDRLTRKDDHMNAGAVTTPASHRKKGHRAQRKEPETVPVEQNEEQDDYMDLTNSFQRGVSPDELAQDDLEGKHERAEVADTSRSEKKKKCGKAIPATIDGDFPFIKADQEHSTQESPQFDPQDPLGEHAGSLRKLLKKDPDALTTLKTHILSGLTGKRRLPLVNLEFEHQKIHQPVEQTVLAGEGNSVLIIGSRGSGKTTLVETVISELAVDHQDDFHVVRLNGFIHTDDKLALREIWRQLGREMDVDNDDLSGRSNYADTLTSLLALLAHPVGEEDGNEAATARSVIFVLDEFDLFASHPRQTLLYNLFDVAQSRNAPIAVLGLTTKVNVVESLEKRVKSRFGQRYVHLSLPKTFTTFQEICLSALAYHPSTHDLLQTSKSDLQRLSTAWNSYITALFDDDSFQNFLQTLHTTTKSIPAFLSASLLPISTLSPTALPTPASFTPPITLQPPDNKLTLLPSLSALELSLLIAAARLDIILSTDICTFSMVYDEYVTLASKSKMQSSAAGQMAQGARVWSQGLAKGAWETLVGLELVLPAAGVGRAGREGMWRVDVGLEEIGCVLERMSGMGMGFAGLGKWCREI